MKRHAPNHRPRGPRRPPDARRVAFTVSGVDLEAPCFPDESHWVLKPQNSMLWHDTVLAWLERFIGGAQR